MRMANKRVGIATFALSMALLFIFTGANGGISVNEARRTARAFSTGVLDTNYLPCLAELNASKGWCWITSQKIRLPVVCTLFVNLRAGTRSA